MTTDDSGAASDHGRGRLPDAEIDERFAAIIAGFEHDSTPTDDATLESVDEATTPDVGDQTPPLTGTGEPAGPGPTILSIPVWRGTTGPSLLDETPEDDDAFVPNPVDLPPSEDVHYWGAVVGLVMGPILVVYVAVAQPFYATWWLLAGLGLCIGGFALLVLRSPNKRDHDDDDSGARV